MLKNIGVLALSKDDRVSRYLLDSPETAKCELQKNSPVVMIE